MAPKSMVSFRLPGDIVERLDRLAEQSGTSRSAIIEELIVARLERRLVILANPAPEEGQLWGDTCAELVCMNPKGKDE